MTIIPYNPYLERTPDTQYSDLLRFIRNSPETFLMKHQYQARGRWTNIATQNLVYYFRNGFPIITERRIPFWKKSITELILFMKGVHTLEEMVAAGCDWWAEWVSPEQCEKFGYPPGELGRGSYGPNLARYPWVVKNPETGELEYRVFNQVENLVQSLKDGPNLNGHVITTWIPPLDMQHSKHRREVVVTPCHGTTIQCTVIDGRKLGLTMGQRSSDAPVGLVANIIQYAAMCIMLGHVCGYEPYVYIHKVNDAQIYENQIECVDELLKRDTWGHMLRKPYRFPRLLLTEEGQKVDNIFDFTADHFELWDYESHSAMKIPTTL